MVASVIISAAKVRKKNKIRKNFFVLRSTFRSFAIKDGENTPSRQKKEMNFFVLRSTFRIFVTFLCESIQASNVKKIRKTKE